MTNDIGNERAVASRRWRGAQIANIRRAYTSRYIHQTSTRARRAGLREAPRTCRESGANAIARGFAAGSMRIATWRAASRRHVGPAKRMNIPRGVHRFLKCDSKEGGRGSTAYNTSRERGESFQWRIFCSISRRKYRYKYAEVIILGKRD